MKKIHDWRTQPDQRWYIQPELGYQLDDRYILFEKYDSFIAIRMLRRYDIHEEGWWRYDRQDIIFEVDLEDPDCWDDIKEHPENYLAEIVL